MSWTSLIRWWWWWWLTNAYLSINLFMNMKITFGQCQNCWCWWWWLVMKKYTKFKWKKESDERLIDYVSMNETFDLYTEWKKTIQKIRTKPKQQQQQKKQQNCPRELPFGFQQIRLLLVTSIHCISFIFSLSFSLYLIKWNVPF